MARSEVLHVVADRDGNIIAAAYLGVTRGAQHDIHVQITPIEGQSVIAVPSTHECGAIESVQDFRRLTTEFHLPPGTQQLARRNRV